MFQKTIRIFAFARLLWLVSGFVFLLMSGCGVLQDSLTDFLSSPNPTPFEVALSKGALQSDHTKSLPIVYVIQFDEAIASGSLSESLLEQLGSATNLDLNITSNGGSFTQSFSLNFTVGAIIEDWETGNMTSGQN